ncbi:uncharacterized protein TNCV_373991 [Trichonephila clavipes]|nr:uncharacterized protein TNCV_373991 [Trichonephila clavipes]
MDDLISGCSSISSAKQLKQELISLFSEAGMQLHKWSSNCIELLSNFDVSGGDVSLTIPDETKALGLLWRPQKDTLAFSVSSIADVSDSCTITKRSVLSTTAKIFDPLGLISPVVTKAKLVMQELWRLKLDWKDSLPIHLETQWKRFVKSLAAINNLDIPRYILLDDALRIELHGYCDSSLRAYGAAIYVKCLHNSGTVSTNLLCSKSRVAPLKSVTIPRLELCAAVLLAKLIRKTIKSMKISFNDIVLWTDSTIVLAWIKKDPSVLKPFVKNRVSVIQHLTEVSSWKHVQSQENPADIISRGIDPDKIQDSVLWWYGPSGLQSNPVVSTCDVSEINDNDLYLREFKKCDPVCLVTQNVELFSIINKCSSFVKLKIILAWCLRFKENARNHSSQRTIGSLTATELSRASICLNRNVQSVHFPLEIQCLLKGKQIPNSSSVLNLSPFLDENSVLRVGGRLKVNARAKNQVMADLPSDRVKVSRVFTKVGIDYAGPFFIKLYRGANNELKKILQNLFIKEGKETIENFIASEGIVWHLNPPATPHFGGLWEAGIKSLKSHLKRVIGNTILTYEEFVTLVTQVESVLNSRPLTKISSDPNDSILTPAHFLVGTSLTALPEPDLTNTPINRLNRWQLVQKLTQTFWKKWSNDYLNWLQSRVKWQRGEQQFKENELVLVKDKDFSKLLYWNLAKIIKVHPGKDNIIRVVTLKTNKGNYQRPVNKLVKLPIYE